MVVLLCKQESIFFTKWQVFPQILGLSSWLRHFHKFFINEIS